MTDSLKNLEKTLHEQTTPYFELHKESEKKSTPFEIEPSCEESLSPAKMTPLQLQSFFEACLFIAEKPLTLQQLIRASGDPDCEEMALKTIETLKEKYQHHSHGIELVHIAGGFQIRTKACHGARLHQLSKIQVQKMSPAAMEILALIAYKQPVVKDVLDTIRGVDSSYHLRSLMERKLIKITGRSELVGKPMLYATTDTFLETFSLNQLSDLPSLLEIQQMIPHSQSDRSFDPNHINLSEQVRHLSESKNTLAFDPEQDDQYLSEVKKKIDEQKITTPHLEELDQALQQTKLQNKNQKEHPTEN